MHHHKINPIYPTEALYCEQLLAIHDALGRKAWGKPKQVVNSAEQPTSPSTPLSLCGPSDIVIGIRKRDQQHSKPRSSQPQDSSNISSCHEVSLPFDSLKTVLSCPERRHLHRCALTKKSKQNINPVLRKAGDCRWKVVASEIRRSSIILYMNNIAPQTLSSRPQAPPYRSI